MGTLEDVLLAEAAGDAASRPTTGQAAGVGAGAGALAGMLAGRGAKGRMAGGLVGALTGGALGGGIQKMMVQESDAGRLLAKLQMGTLTDVDKFALENLLANRYSNAGIV